MIRAVGSSSYTELNIGMNNFYVGGVPPSVALNKTLGQVSATIIVTNNPLLLIFNSPTQVSKLALAH